MYDVIVTEALRGRVGAAERMYQQQLDIWREMRGQASSSTSGKLKSKSKGKRKLLSCETCAEC